MVDHGTDNARPRRSVRRSAAEAEQPVQRSAPRGRGRRLGRQRLRIGQRLAHRVRLPAAARHLPVGEIGGQVLVEALVAAQRDAVVPAALLDDQTGARQQPVTLLPSRLTSP